MSSASEIPKDDGNIITQSGIFSLTPFQPPGEENNNVIKRFVSLVRKKRYRVNIYIYNYFHLFRGYLPQESLKKRQYFHGTPNARLEFVAYRYFKFFARLQV